MESPQVAAAFALLAREDRLDQVYADFRGAVASVLALQLTVDAVDARFGWIWLDVGGYLQRLETVSCVRGRASFVLILQVTDEDEQVSDVPVKDGNDNAHQVIVDLLDRLALWQRTWGTPLKAMKE